MELNMNFGTLTRSAARPLPTERFRLAVLGDFSARANSRQLAKGEELARRKPLQVDVDNLDELIERMQLKLHLNLPSAEGIVEVAITDMDSFHPDQLFEQLALFAELASLRRRLQHPHGFAAAAAEVMPWLDPAVRERIERPRPEPRGADVPDGGLDDFAQLLGLTSIEQDALAGVEQLARQLVAPHIVPGADPAQAEMVAAVDTALSAAMRGVLHHPDFRAAESLWRSVEMLTRRLETGPALQIALYDIAAEEIAADLSSVDDLERSGLYKLLVEQPAADAHRGPLSLMVGNYQFSRQAGHLDLLGRIAKIATAAGAPFVAGMKWDPEASGPAEVPAWSELCNLPEAAALQLTCPRFLQRLPYGKNTSPIESFQFEELASPEDTSGLLWGNSAVLAGMLRGQAFALDGQQAMPPNSHLIVSGLPFYWYTDEDGDQAAVPCAEVSLTERQIERVADQGLIPVVAMKGRPEVRLAGFRSLADR